MIVRAASAQRSMQVAWPCLALCLACCAPTAFDGLSGGRVVRDASLEDGGAPDDAALTLDAAVDAGDGPTLEAGSDGSAADAALDATRMDGQVVTSDAGPMVDASTATDSAMDSSAAVDASDARVVDAGPITRSFVIAADQDDAVWLISGVNELEESLHFSAAAHSSAGYTIEVGTDGEQCRAGLRFQLPLGRGARIVAASLTLTRVGPQSTADPNDTMRVHVYDADTVGAFDHAHVHSDPREHVAGGLWSQSVGGFHVGPSYAATESGDLSELLQHVIDRPGWTRNAYVGFVLTPDQMARGDYAQFADQVEEAIAPATLKLTYFDAP